MTTTYCAYWSQADTPVLEFGQYPLWCPYFGGGYPIYAHPEFPSCNPSLLLTLAFGAIFGLKLCLLFMHMGLAASMYYLTRRALRWELGPALAATLIVTFSGWAPGKIFSGNFNELSLGLTPAVLGLVIAYGREGGRWRLMVGGALVALILVDGKTTFALCLFFVALWVGLSSWSAGGRTARRYVIAVAAIALAAFLFSAAKWLPTARWVQWFRLWGSSSGAAVYSRAMGYENVYAIRLTTLPLLILMPVYNTSQSAYSMFVGLVPICLAVAALVVAWRRVWRWGALLLIALLLVMGPSSPVDLFRPLSMIPVFHAITMPGKYFSFFVVLCLAMLSGELLRSRGVLGRRLLRRALTFVACAGALSVGGFELPKFRAPFQVPEAVEPGAFYQVRLQRVKSGSPRPGLRSPYNAVRSNVGIINWYTSIPTPTQCRPKYIIDKRGAPCLAAGYRGEAFPLSLFSRSSVEVLSFTPNRIRLRARAFHDDLLIVNQNYNDAWSAGAVPVQEVNGMLALPVRPGDSVIELRFSPADIELGIGVSLLSMVVAVCLCARHTRRRGRTPSA